MQDDLISRQAVLDINESHHGQMPNHINHQIWQEIKDLPSVNQQPEIIRCYQCKYAKVADPEDNQDGYTCQFHRGSIWFSGSYCSWAERRQDG